VLVMDNNIHTLLFISFLCHTGMGLMWQKNTIPNLSIKIMFIALAVADLYFLFRT